MAALQRAEKKVCAQQPWRIAPRCHGMLSPRMEYAKRLAFVVLRYRGGQKLPIQQPRYLRASDGYVGADTKFHGGCRSFFCDVREI
ncbi:MAG TPA: hypothetical protein DCW68_05820 [Rhodospirillaceae bacterium]|nr:hypothetical protein [Rhodospirillaceae bacterium]